MLRVTVVASIGSVHGVLKGYDQLVNLVLDDTMEYLRGDPRSTTVILPRLLFGSHPFVMPTGWCSQTRRILID